MTEQGVPFLLVDQKNTGRLLTTGLFGPLTPWAAEGTSPTGK